MTSVVKLTQRVPNRSLINKIFYYSNKTLSTFTKCHVYPSHIISINRNNICPINIYSSQHYRLLSTSQDKNNEEEQPSEEESQEDESEEEIEESDESDEKIRNLDLKIQELQTELKKYQDALARSHADIVNIQNMNKKDVENAKKFATKSFSKDMLNVADSLTGCIDGINEHIKKTGEQIDENLKSVIDGVKITQNTLHDTFGRHGITKIESLHQEFDPNYHEALFRQPTSEHPPDTVVTVVSEGYAIKDTVLRAAKVGVATEMPQEQTQTKTEESDETVNENEVEDKKEE